MIINIIYITADGIVILYILQLMVQLYYLYYS